MAAILSSLPRLTAAHHLKASTTARPRQCSINSNLLPSSLLAVVMDVSRLVSPLCAAASSASRVATAALTSANAAARWSVRPFDIERVIGDYNCDKLWHKEQL
ncbi:hypothetical protein FHL15_000883 [Xylaria flabelliformis]|uniref:Uncharacterized protein n=1 Tax=Xylaria flabelliformis TaxID=2512241 RepID=A0A553IDF8_9PEZI|nr:hypothetical protein FHL15_000883 [Xylaria flabelliformis]